MPDPDDGDVWCNCKHRRFPPGDFYDDPVHGVVHYVGVERPHTTLGEDIDGPPLPGLPDAAPPETNGE